MSSVGFDAPSEVDRGSLTFGWSGDEPSWKSCKSKLKDVDGECTFTNKDTRFQPGDLEGIMKGSTFDGTLFEGSDSVSLN